MNSIPKKRRPKPARCLGQRYGRLVAVGPLEFARVGVAQDTRSYVWCVCDCGRRTRVACGALFSGATRSCRCLQRDVTRQRQLTHGESKGSRRTNLYKRWQSMISRCYYPTEKNRAGYAGRGITICDEWRHSYESFRDWALANGFAEHLTIDRTDNDKGYSPENCRWVPFVVNANNTQASRWIEALGDRQSLAMWGRDPRCAVSAGTLRARLKVGVDPDTAVTTPSRKSGFKKRAA